MTDTTRGYPVQDRRLIAASEGLRVQVLALDAGQEVPWHLHTQIIDTFFCMRGPMQVSTRAPQQCHVLAPGQTCAVPAGMAHQVQGVNGGACEFMIVQGVGTYDFVPIA